MRKNIKRKLRLQRKKENILKLYKINDKLENTNFSKCLNEQKMMLIKRNN